MDTFTRSYIDAILFTEGWDDLTIDDFSPECLAVIVEDCRIFQIEMEDYITPENLKKSGCPDEQAGHDFWLTRNGHGAGFWDGDWKDKAGKAMTAHAKTFGQFDVYLGDDGKIYS